MSGYIIVLGHIFGYVTSKVWRDHIIYYVIDHVIVSQGHMPTSWGHVGESLSSLFGCNLALGSDWVCLGVSHMIPS